ncbi:MAG: hypothetical protein EA377_03140 [Phycisphaerales bacterium]|nr:MAG: hypothetical protein EA377_03140 [Phycisphaerales bacterium]
MVITRVTACSVIVLAAMLLSGCNNSMKEEVDLLTQENEDLRAQLADRNQALDAATSTARDREMEARRLARELDEARRQREERPAATSDRTGFEGIAGVTGSIAAGEVTASVDSDVLFASGSADLRQGARQSLNQVAQVLNSNYSGRPIRIVGHTDTDPIRRSGFKSNYHLGFERAYAVREYLISRGVSAERIHLASFGPHRPRGTKAQSRRVEIVVMTQ